MAKKRRIAESEEGRAAREAQEQREDEKKRNEQSLRHWLVKDYARRWYVVLCLAIDIFGGLQFGYLGIGALGIVVVIAFEAAALVIEYFVYRHIWQEEEE